MSKYVLQSKNYKKSRLDFFLTNAGKKFVGYGIGTVAVCIGAAVFLPNTVFVKKYKKIFQAYRLVSRDRSIYNEISVTLCMLVLCIFISALGLQDKSPTI